MYKHEYSAIILAAGSGSRCLDIHKPFFPINGRCVINYLLDTVILSNIFEEIVVVVPEDSLDLCKRLIEYTVIVVPSGGTRTESMSLGLAATDAKYVMVHEGARPFVSIEHIESLKDAFVDYGRIPTITVKPVIDLATLDGNAIARSRVQLLEPPMLIRVNQLRELIDFSQFGKVDADSVEMTHIASGGLWTSCPLVGINYKMTVFEDLLLAERYLK